VLFLVTTGFERLQRSKVAALGIATLFEAIQVDALDDPSQRPGKKQLFQRIMAAHDFASSEVAVIGDSLHEIRAGNQLGLTTIQVLRDGVREEAEAQHHVATFAALPRLLLNLHEARYKP
jgi:putative hydrolase of the HAD superfamily